jgi:hemerythrin-like domain-containing protein
MFMQEHQIILRALDVLDTMAARTERDERVEPEDVETLLRFLHTFADDHHQMKEESALFPELMRTSLANAGRLRQMRFEHDQERSLVDGLEDALRTKKGVDFVEFANWLTRLIRTHIQKEDEVLFEIAQRSLSTEQDEAITAELEKFPVDPGVFADLERLEMTYLHPAA